MLSLDHRTHQQIYFFINHSVQAYNVCLPHVDLVFLTAVQSNEMNWDNKYFSPSSPLPLCFPSLCWLTSLSSRLPLPFPHSVNLSFFRRSVFISSLKCPANWLVMRKYLPESLRMLLRYVQRTWTTHTCACERTCTHTHLYRKHICTYAHVFTHPECDLHWVLLIYTVQYVMYVLIV